jgi:hypothetical protein
MIERGFWRGFAPLLAFYGATALTVQIDLYMIAPLGAGASSAFLTLTRVAALDLVLMAATGAVASVLVAKARFSGHTREIVPQICRLASLIGAGAGTLGCLVYRDFIAAVTGGEEIAAIASSAIVWFGLSSPFRFFVNVCSFALHALGDGSAVVRWKTFAVVAKIVGNWFFIDAMGYGFAGCFISNFVIAGISSIWSFRRVRSHGVALFGAPQWTYARAFLRCTALEAQRLLWPQLAMSISVVLVSAPWIGLVDYHRVDAFSAGQILILFVLTPMTALTRFFALRLAGLSRRQTSEMVWTLWIRGTPAAFGAGVVLFVASEWLGRAVYRQEGAWWYALVEALALSLPIRYVANVMRAVLHSRASFAPAAASDSLASWWIALPLLALGLFLDEPRIAYLSLLAPEAFCALWLTRQMPFSIRLGAARFLRRLLNDGRISVRLLFLDPDAATASISIPSQAPARRRRLGGNRRSQRDGVLLLLRRHRP